MTLATRLLTSFFGHCVGTDSLGNRYYQRYDRGTNGEKRERRWVLYNGKPEASKVPPVWHAWLHKTTDRIPTEITPYAWQKPHLPNQTGTPNAYVPLGHPYRGGQRQQARGDYDAWTPAE